ncbi:restriction endonuclease subunit S [Actinobacillus indolicus]|uniref:Restriction endonuclease subunit S n=1 Tax=Actinobacillus indolicus TaxID=51049 RepID=A0A4P7CME9_9PAST|nr:restriction endonuclease subunit S [Actinobacillus indolicus]QBQ64597.1 restriction endonuclease subunit S [Actinobacillus indolicus]
MNRYESYKDSGVEWLGDVPSHWDIKKLKHLLNFQTGGTPSSGHALFYDGDLPWITIADLNGKYTNQTHFISRHGQKSANIPLTPKGSLLYSFKLSVGQVAFAHQDLYTNEAIASFLATNNNNLNYYFYMLPIFIAKNANKNIYGADILNQDLIKNSCLLSIPKAEQTAIAQYLDNKTAKIDQAIMLEEKQIELLKEHKQILIQDAVTKGLNPHVKFKHSGVEWIGEVPEHWEVKKISHVFERIGSGTTPNSSDTSYYDGQINWLQTGDLTDGKIFTTSKTITYKALKNYSTLKIYPKNSLVIAMYGATIGKVGLLQIETATNQACCVLATTHNAVIEFAFYLFKGIKDNLIAMSYGGGQPNISQDKIKSLRLPFAPLSEQQKIVQYLDEQTAKIDLAIQLKQQQINKLKEYKTVLINDVVTGKVKVA